MPWCFDAVNVSIEAEDLLEGVRKGKLVQLVGRVPAAGHERAINVCDSTSVDIVVHTRTYQSHSACDRPGTQRAEVISLVSNPSTTSNSPKLSARSALQERGVGPYRR